MYPSDTGSLGRLGCQVGHLALALTAPQFRFIWEPLLEELGWGCVLFSHFSQRYEDTTLLHNHRTASNRCLDNRLIDRGTSDTRIYIYIYGL